MVEPGPPPPLNLPEGEGATMALVIGLDGARSIAISPANEVPNADLVITFQAKENMDGAMVLDNILIQADQPAPDKNDCPELVDFFNVIQDMTEGEEGQEAAETSTQKTLTLLK